MEMWTIKIAHIPISPEDRIPLVYSTEVYDWTLTHELLSDKKRSGIETGGSIET